MMNAAEASRIAAELLHRDGLYLDCQQWDEWLSLYAEDVVYWVPAWRNEDQLVTDVKREVSLIYHESNAGLQERILRIRTRKSVTAMPLARTAHLVSNVMARATGDESIEGTASWTVNEYDPRLCKANQNFGRYEFELRRIGGVWRYQRKTTILVNDLIPTIIDFYNL